MTNLDRLKGWRICTCQPHSHICPFDVCKLECEHPRKAIEVDLYMPVPLPGAPRNVKVVRS